MENCENFVIFATYFMNSIILIAIFGIALLCMMLLVNNNTSLAEDSAKADATFNMQMALSDALNACKGDEEPLKIYESQHLTCQHTRAGDIQRPHFFCNDIRKFLMS